MAAGLPVVSSRSDGILDIVEDGVTGLLVDPRDIPELTSAVETLIVEPSLRRKFGASGRRRIEERFTLERMVDQVEEIYQKCLTNRNG